jgi:hypothetical protein
MASHATKATIKSSTIIPSEKYLHYRILRDPNVNGGKDKCFYPLFHRRASVNILNTILHFTEIKIELTNESYTTSLV